MVQTAVFTAGNTFAPEGGEESGVLVGWHGLSRRT